MFGPFAGAFFLEWAHLQNGIIVIPFRHSVGIRPEVGFHHSLVRVDTADDVIGSEQKLFA